MGFERYSVVRVPFPFSGRVATRNRPALILSDAAGFNAPPDARGVRTALKRALDV